MNQTAQNDSGAAGPATPSAKPSQVGPPALLAHIQFFFRTRLKRSVIEYPFRGILAANRIEIGTHVRIKKHAWFSLRPGCRVSIGDNTSIGRYFVISGISSSIDIEDNVLISERVFVTESNHDFTDMTLPGRGGTALSGGPVRIGSGTWIGIGACILPNVSIGRRCVIGANAVVTRNVPDYCMAVGVPARVIKKYDFEKRAWVPVASEPGS